MSSITGIVHALVEQDAVCAIVLSASCADRRAAAYPHSTQMREPGSEHNFQAFLRAVCSTREGNETDEVDPLSWSAQLWKLSKEKSVKTLKKTFMRSVKRSR